MLGLVVPCSMRVEFMVKCVKYVKCVMLSVLSMCMLSVKYVECVKELP